MENNILEDGYSMKRKMAVLIIIVALLLIVGIYKYNSSGRWQDGLKTPDKINLYLDEKQAQLIKGSDHNTEKLFNKITQLIQFYMPDIVGIDNPISDSEAKEMKKYSIEYVYDKTQSIPVNNGQNVS